MTGPDEKPILAVTLGDPAGVGPEIVAGLVSRQAADAELRAVAAMLVVGDGDLLEARARRVGAGLSLPRVESPEEMRELGLDAACLAGAEAGPAEDVIGRVDALAGRACIRWVKAASALAFAGSVDGIVTGPIHKLALTRAGFRYEGHTELLEELARMKSVMMLMCDCPGGGLKVALATRHVAVKDVPRLLTGSEIVRTGRTLDEALRSDFAISAPRIGVLALNPHASDGGRFGDEEKRVIGPAVKALRAAGVEADGPIVPDVAFWRARQGSHDALVAMYHDQGLVAVKTLAFDTGVNVTLGLPIVRTSPDHGTAFDIAGSGEASAESFAQAVRVAALIARNRRGAGR